MVFSFKSGNYCHVHKRFWWAEAESACPHPCGYVIDPYHSRDLVRVSFGVLCRTDTWGKRREQGTSPALKDCLDRDSGWILQALWIWRLLPRIGPYRSAH